MYIYVVSKLRHNAENKEKWERQGISELEGRIRLNKVYERYISLHRGDFPNRDIVDLWRRTNNNSVADLIRVERFEAAAKRAVAHSSKPKPSSGISGKVFEPANQE